MDDSSTGLYGQLQSTSNQVRQNPLHCRFLCILESQVLHFGLDVYQDPMFGALE